MRRTAFGQPVTLQDGSTITAIVKQRRAVAYNGTEAREIAHVVLNVPDALAGSIAQGQTVTVRGIGYYIAAGIPRGDGWTTHTLSPPP